MTNTVVQIKQDHFTFERCWTALFFTNKKTNKTGSHFQKNKVL